MTGLTSSITQLARPARKRLAVRAILPTLSGMSDRVWVVIALLTVGSGALQAQGARERLPGWNASFAVPTGWRVLQRSGRAAALTDTLETAAVFVAATFLATAADAAAELRAMFEDLHYAATPVGTPIDTTIGGRRAQVGSYHGAGRAGPVDARSVVVFTVHGTGVTVLGVTSAERSAAVAAVVLRVAASIEAAAPATNSAWLSGLAGHWKYVPPPAAAQDSTAAGTAAIDEWLEFDGRERFTWRSRTVVSMRLPGAGPLVAERDRDSGTYTVVGNTLVLRGASTRALEIQQIGRAHV